MVDSCPPCWPATLVTGGKGEKRSNEMVSNLGYCCPPYLIVLSERTHPAELSDHLSGSPNATALLWRYQNGREDD